MNESSGIVITLAIVTGFIVFLFLVLKNKKMNPAQTTTQLNSDQVSPLDEKIKSKFKLFQGLRSQEEDQKIYDKVMDLTFSEMMTYLGENLPEEDRNKFLEEMANAESEDGKNKIMQAYFSKVENVKISLAWRIEKFLNNLLYTSLKAKTAI